MAVHLFRVLVGPQSSWAQADVNAAIEDWMSKQSEWTADPAEHSMTGTTHPETGLQWWQGDYRLTFESEPKDNLFQKLEDKLTNKPEWYRVAYDECDHDTEGSACDWAEQRDWPSAADVPSEVPAYV